MFFFISVNCTEVVKEGIWFGLFPVAYKNDDQNYDAGPLCPIVYGVNNNGILYRRAHWYSAFVNTVWMYRNKLGTVPTSLLRSNYEGCTHQCSSSVHRASGWPQLRGVLAVGWPLRQAVQAVEWPHRPEEEVQHRPGRRSPAAPIDCDASYDVSRFDSGDCRL